MLSLTNHIPQNLELKTSFSSWAASRNYKATPGTGSPWTHTSLIGGIFDTTNLIQFGATFGDESVKNLSLEEKKKIFRAQEDEFLKMLGQAIYKSSHSKIDPSGFVRKLRKNDFLFICEKKSDIFKFFVDFDFKAPIDKPDGFASKQVLLEKEKRILGRINSGREKPADKSKLEKCKKFIESCDEEKFTKFTSTVQEVMKKFYPQLIEKDNLNVIICTTMPKILTSRDQDDTIYQHKDGVHMIWPDIIVNQTQALYIRESLIYKLSEVFGERREEEGFNSWNDVVDEGVYGDRSGGLRMIGCRKADKCNLCFDRKSKVKKSNSNCNCDSGHFHTSRTYWPEYYCNNNGIMTRELSDKLKTLLSGDDKYEELMKLTSIRSWSSETTKEYNPPNTIPVPLPQIKSTTTKRRLNGQIVFPQRQHDEDKKALSSMRRKILFDRDHPWKELFQELIRSSFNYHKNIVVKNIYSLPQSKSKKSNHPSYIITVEGEGSSYCMNLRNNHKSNTVWFWLTSEFIVQKCFCRCDVVRQSGIKCKDFVSRKVAFNNFSKFYNHIFPPLYHGTENDDQVKMLAKNIKHDVEERDINTLSFLNVLWNNISRSGSVVGGGDKGISTGDSSLNYQLIQDLKNELNNSNKK